VLDSSTGFLLSRCGQRRRSARAQSRGRRLSAAFCYGWWRARKKTAGGLLLVVAAAAVGAGTEQRKKEI
jgi:hypothetical protein